MVGLQESLISTVLIEPGFFHQDVIQDLTICVCDLLTRDFIFIKKELQ